MKLSLTKEAKKNYNLMAESYHKARTNPTTVGWFYNEYLEMPTTLKMLGNVRGKKILDIGCGTGLYARILKKKGANVKGIDISERMVEIARKEVPNIEFKIGTAEKLPYKSKEFDIVLAALMTEYLSSWNKMLKEVKRVLKPHGLFIFSTGNPVINAQHKLYYKGRKFREIKDYFRERLKISCWDKDGKSVKMIWHHKTYGTIVKYIVKNGFELIDYEDAKPIKTAKKYFPEYYKKTMNMPYFCTWKVRKN
jgi:ubiquinone/menaquinone biosynthesis C-methylase UbiE